MYKIGVLEEVEQLLDINSKLAFDTETNGFYGRIETAQFYQEHWPEVLIVIKPDPYYLAKILTDQPFVAHLAHYDITTIQEQTGTAWVPNNFDCTFYSSRLHFFHRQEFSLDKVLTYVLSHDPYKQAEINKSKLQKSNWADELNKEQLTYAAIDVLYLLEVLKVTSPALEAFNYKLDILFTKACLNFQWNGMPVLEKELNIRYESNEHEIAKMNMPINVNSWQQVRAYIEEDESDALALTRFKLNGNERAGNVLKTRKLIKENMFLNKFDEQSGRIYGKFLPSARSGRCTSKDQNLQQLPRKTKTVFGTRDDSGRILVYADYSQLELRGVTIITGETRMEVLYREGKDIHGHTTMNIIAVDYTDTQRHVGKTCNFNLLYGGSAGMLGSILLKDAEILMLIDELAKIKKSWHKLWPTITKWQQTGIAAWRHKQPWQTPLGRKYTAKLMTDQLNIQVQGFGAEVAKLATHYMSKELDGLTHDKFMLCNFVHDSWVFEADNDPEVYKPLADTIAHSMQEAWFECSKATKIKDLPMPVDVFVGYNWGKIEKEYIATYHYD